MKKFLIVFFSFFIAFTSIACETITFQVSKADTYRLRREPHLADLKQEAIDTALDMCRRLMCYNVELVSETQESRNYRQQNTHVFYAIYQGNYHCL